MYIIFKEATLVYLKLKAYEPKYTLKSEDSSVTFS